MIILRNLEKDFHGMELSTAFLRALPLNYRHRNRYTSMATPCWALSWACLVGYACGSIAFTTFTGSNASSKSFTSSEPNTYTRNNACCNTHAIGIRSDLHLYRYISRCLSGVEEEEHTLIAQSKFLFILRLL